MRKYGSDIVKHIFLLSIKAIYLYINSQVSWVSVSRAISQLLNSIFDLHLSQHIRVAWKLLHLPSTQCTLEIQFVWQWYWELHSSKTRYDSRQKNFERVWNKELTVSISQMTYNPSILLWIQSPFCFWMLHDKFDFRRNHKNYNRSI